MLLAFLAVQADPAGAGSTASDPQGEDAPTVEVRVPRESQDELWEGTLTGVLDGQDFAETPGYRRLLEILSQRNEQSLAEETQRQLVVADALAEPDAWRGDLVRVRGLVAWMQAVKLAAPIGEFTDVYRALVTQPDGTAGVAVDFLHPPPELQLQRDVIDVEGVLFNTVRYENQRDQPVEAPHLIARGLRRLDLDTLPRSTALEGLGRVLVGAAVAFLIVRVILLVRRKRTGVRKADASRLLCERAHGRSRPSR
jgi:hypothetical protein